MKEAIKKTLKQIPGFDRINGYRKKMNCRKEFDNDCNFFLKNYISSKPITIEKMEYDMILEIHKIEKGIACLEPRPFGIEKVKKIMELIESYEKITDEKSFSYNLAYSCLEAYLKFYEEREWQNREEYKLVQSFMKNASKYEQIEVGAFNYKYENNIKDSKIDYDKFLSSRRSIRNFADKKLTEEDITKAINMSIKSPSACNRQMCKIYYIKSKAKTEIIKKRAQGLGLFDLSNANFFVVTFDVSATYFIGERNQGWFNAGLMSMNFVNALHSLGIGSCFIQFGNSFKEEQIMKKELEIPESERIAVIITAGYYDEISRIPYSTRKEKDDIFFER